MSKARVIIRDARRLKITGNLPDQLSGGAAPKGLPGRRFPWWILLVILLALPAAFFIRLPETPLEKAIALVKANRAAAALPILEEIAQKQPDTNLYLPWLAQCYLSTDRLAEGRTALDTAIKMRLPCGTVTPIVLNFSAYYRQKNDFAEAEKLLASAQMSCPASDFQQEREAIYSGWADDDIKINRIDQAISHLETLNILEVGKPDERLSHKLSELYRQQAAIEETQNGDDKKAIELLEKSLKVADEPASRLALGNLFAKNNDFKQAVLHLGQVCKADPNNLEARHRLIEMCMKINDFQGAQDAANELADREKSVENFGMLANIDLKLMNFAGAVRALEEATTLAPKDLLLLGQLRSVLDTWAVELQKQGKQEESVTIKTRAERVTETIKAVQKELNPETTTRPAATNVLAPGSPPIALTASRIWLSKGSLTPEGEIKIKNVGEVPLNELALTVAFFDKTTRKRTGAVTVSAAGTTHPMPPGQTRILYFSSPNIVHSENQLSVLIYWKGKLIRELPVVKEK